MMGQSTEDRSDSQRNRTKEAEVGTARDVLRRVVQAVPARRVITRRNTTAPETGGA